METAGESACPNSLGEALEGVPRAQRDHYLCLREAFLALRGTSESFQAGDPFWQPRLHVGHSVVATVNFAQRGRKGMALRPMPLRGAWLDHLPAAGELQRATRKFLHGLKDRRHGEFKVRDEVELAEAVAILMLMHAHLHIDANA